MKIRSGFVSNSSSSSFIILVKDKIESVEQLASILTPPIRGASVEDCAHYLFGLDGLKYCGTVKEVRDQLLPKYPPECKVDIEKIWNNDWYDYQGDPEEVAAGKLHFDRSNIDEAQDTSSVWIVLDQMKEKEGDLHVYVLGASDEDGPIGAACENSQMYLKVQWMKKDEH